MSQIFGVQGNQIVQMIGALLVVVVLIVVFAWVMRRFGGGSRQPAARRGERPTQRLAVVDAAHVDGQRRLVLVRRDDVEHLVMIGGPNDVLIEPRIVRGQPMGGQRMAPAVPYPVAVPVAQQPALHPQQQQPQPVRATGAAQQQPTTAQQDQAVPMPPPFVEPVTSPAASSRANPIAADLRAAMGDSRRPDDLVDTQRDPYATRQHSAPQPAPQPAQRHAPPPVYDEPTVAAPRQSYAPEPAPYAPPQRPAATRQPSPNAAPSLEDMVAAGLEQAISRPDPAPTRPVTRSSGAAFGQRVDPNGFDGRTPAKDAVAAEIEKAIYGLTAPGGPTAGRGPVRQDIARPAPYGSQRDAEPAPRPVGRYDAQRPAPQEPTVAISRLPQATTPSFPRTPTPVRPTLVSQPEPPVPEPVVAVMPPPDAVRNDARADNGRRSSSDIEDEMARLLSELTGTAGR